MDHEQSRSYWRSPAELSLLGAVLVGGFYLVSEHTAHLLGILPYLFILACPLMHFFMHRGHGHGGHSQTGRQDDDQRRQ